MWDRENHQFGFVSWVVDSMDDEATIRLNLEALEGGIVGLLDEILSARADATQ